MPSSYSALRQLVIHDPALCVEEGRDEKGRQGAGGESTPLRGHLTELLVGVRDSDHRGPRDHGSTPGETACTSTAKYNIASAHQ